MGSNSVPPELDLIFGPSSRHLALEFRPLLKDIVPAGTSEIKDKDGSVVTVATGSKKQGKVRGKKRNKSSKSLLQEIPEVTDKCDFPSKVENLYDFDAKSSSSDSSLSSNELAADPDTKKLKLEESLWKETFSHGVDCDKVTTKDNQDAQDPSSLGGMGNKSI